MIMQKKAGISLIVLVITIIVILILAAAIILNLSGNNPITQASKAAYLSDVRSFQTELDMYKTKQFSDNLGNYDPTLLQADETSLTYKGVTVQDKTIHTLIPSLGQNTKYAGQFKVVDGELVFGGPDTNQQNWSREIGVNVVIEGAPTTVIIPPVKTVVKSGVDLVYTVKFSSNFPLKTVDLNNKVEILDNSLVPLQIQPNISIGIVSGTNSDTVRQVDITIDTKDLTDGSYKIKVTAGAAINSDNVQSNEAISLVGFDISSTAPTNPVMSASPATPTNGNVLVTITYSQDSVVKEYSLDSESWSNYTSPVMVSSNNTTVYARGKNLADLESGVSTITIVNIDKVPPTITATSGSLTSSSLTINTSASDTGGSNLNGASYQYSKDNGATWTDTTTSTSYTFDKLTTGTYECLAKVADNAGNVSTSNIVSMTTQALGTITMSANPTSWTNGNVTVTVTYPSEAVIKQYSTDGTTWNDYTTSIVVSTNNTTVYAKGLDSGNNQLAQATLTVANIDRTSPAVAFGTNGGTYSTQVSTTVTVSDANGVNTSTLQYVWSTQNSTTPSSGWTAFTNGANITKTGDGLYYLWIKANDNAGNNVTTVSNKYTIGEVADEIVSTVQSINTIFSGATSGYSYNNPVIPAGFVAVNTTDANWNNLSTDWNNGLVIQDTSGNQFVWVPVDGTNVPYAKWCTTSISYSSTTDDTLPSGFDTNSITTTYKGFYIARYESMFDYNSGSIRVAIKKSTNKTTSNWSTARNATYNGYLWNFINYTDSKMYSENMDTSYGYNTSLVGTNLITGTEWDTVLKWIQNSGKSVTDSRTWGNHSNSMSPANVSGYASLQISGYSNNWKAKNIYDLAGNTNEWTSEKYTTNFVKRGGNYSSDGSTYPVAFRNSSVESYTNPGVTFRVALYVL